MSRSRTAPSILPAAGPHTAEDLAGAHPDGVVLRVANPLGGGETRRGEPVSVGIPFASGVLVDIDQLRLEGVNDTALDLQAEAQSFWPDGSLEWVLLHWNLTDDGQYWLRFDAESAGPGARTAVIEPQGSGLRVAYEDWHCDVQPGAFPLSGIALPGGASLEAGAFTLVIETSDGGAPDVLFDVPTVESSGPVRTVVHSDGVAKSNGRVLLELETRLYIWGNGRQLELELTVRNPSPAAHPRGLWGLGSEGSVYVRRVELRINGPSPATSKAFALWPERGASAPVRGTEVRLYQDSSGGEAWSSRNHVNRDDTVPLAFRGYRLQCDDLLHEGHRASPVLVVHNSGGTAFSVAVDEFWQNFPKALAAEPGCVTIGLFPPDSQDVHELQGGEQKTHRILMDFAASGAERLCEQAMPLAWSCARAVVSAAPEWYANAGAVPYLVPEASDPHERYVEFVRAAVDGPESFDVKRERIDEYGWRNFGCLYADHEAAYHTGETPLISHYNNQYDAVAGFAAQYFRTGDWRWFKAMDALARHVVDIDVYHTDGDKAGYNHGLFWHTTHYTDAALSAHRTYPRLEGVHGGGPSPEHLYSHGLLLHYYLTGCQRSRETVVAFGQYVIDADDGTRTVFGLLDKGPTGMASWSGNMDYHGPGRGPGNAIDVLLNAYRCCGDWRFLHKAEELIERCIHPEDDLSALNLLDVETRWFYMVFLRSLCTYLNLKSASEHFDYTYWYAKEALTHYLRWAAQHEYPYLTKPEKLEYPTETWAAQELRKAEVFDLGSRYVDGDDRERFRERASFFFDAALDELARHPTRTFCRPLVLLMNYGFRRAWFCANRPEAPDDGPWRPPAYAGPSRFVRQKRRALNRLKVGIGLTVAASVAFIGSRLL